MPKNIEIIEIDKNKIDSFTTKITIAIRENIQFVPEVYEKSKHMDIKQEKKQHTKFNKLQL